MPMQEAWVQSLGQKDYLEKEMATHFSIDAWKIRWTEKYQSNHTIFKGQHYTKVKRVYAGLSL